MDVEKKVAELLALDAVPSVPATVFVTPAAVNARPMRRQEREKKKADERLEQVRRQAIDKCVEALCKMDFSDERQMNRTTLKDLSYIVANLRKAAEIGVVPDVEAYKEGARLIIYAPEVNNIENYNQVIVEEL